MYQCYTRNDKVWRTFVELSMAEGADETAEVVNELPGPHHQLLRANVQITASAASATKNSAKIRKCVINIRKVYKQKSAKNIKFSRNW